MGIQSVEDKGIDADLELHEAIEKAIAEQTGDESALPTFMV